MPERAFATKELARLLNVLSHPERIRIIEELRTGEMDVNSLQKILAVPHSRVSQNLSLLRSNRIVAERRDGRHVFYRLVQPGLARWLLDGLLFLERGAALNEEMRIALDRARQQWLEEPDQAAAVTGAEGNASGG
jgi:DNA-binding transcriptional ArsR family regulator